MYVTQAEIQGKVPAPHLNDALDDDRDGRADDGVLDQVIATACNDVDAYLAPRYEVPFTEPPAVVVAAALIFACEAVYDRRQILDKNPFSDRADKWRDRLEKLGQGAGSLDVALEEESGAQSGGAPRVPNRLTASEEADA